MAEMPAAMPLTSRTERRTALFHGAGDVFDLFDGDLHSVIDLLQTGMGTVVRVAEKGRPRTRPVRARNGRWRRFGQRCPRYGGGHPA